MTRKLPWAEIVVTMLAVGAGLAVYLYAHRDGAQLEESKQHGTEIVRALADYAAERGTYPVSLDELVPQHLPAVPQPTWGLRRWSYRRYTPADVSARAAPRDSVYFSLAVAANESGYPVLFYDLTIAQWVLNN
ncbi:MAG: hypothetical protein WEF86_14825 [Gemmatimonadota bacterium]